MTRRFSLHKIHSETDFSFDPADYSRFKFGDVKSARIFGENLAHGFIHDYLKNNKPDKQLVVISSPYSFIPTATFAMKNYFVFALNRWLAENNLPVTQETKVFRTITYKEDYGELSSEQRMKLIGNDSFHIDKSFLENKILLFLDDIRITGSHERMILRMAEEYGIDNEIHILYFAELMNKNIHPRIENYLNYYSVKNIFDLEEIIRSTHFAINTRIVKYILNYEFSAFHFFIENQSAGFVTELFDMAVGNGYHTIEAYNTNFSYLKKSILNQQKKHDTLWQLVCKKDKENQYMRLSSQ